VLDSVADQDPTPDSGNLCRYPVTVARRSSLKFSTRFTLPNPRSSHLALESPKPILILLIA
jgi:hypothetical protein